MAYRLVVTKLWINGRASERCCDDKAETSEVQAERIRASEVSGDRRVALQRRRIQITVDRILRARGKMKNKANGPADCCVTEMLQYLPMETGSTDGSWERCRAPEAWKILRVVFLEKPDAKLQKGLRGFIAIS